MPTINATVFTAEAYVLVEVDWTDYPQVAYARVERRNTITGEVVTLRPYIAYDGDGNLLLSCGLGLWWDTEPPLNVPLEYCTYAGDPDTAINSNTDFETTLAPWVGVAGAASQSAAFAHTGSFSALLVPAATAANAYISDATGYTTLQPGVEATMDAWFFTPQGWNGVFTQVTLQYEDGLLESFKSPIYAVGVSVWQLVHFTFTSNRVAIVAAIDAIVTGLAPNTINMYIDDVALTQPVAFGISVCDTVTVASESAWLKSPLFPCSDIEVGSCSPAMDFDCEEDSRVSYVGMAEDRLAPNTVLSEPANRKHSIPTSRVRRAPISELRLLAHDCDARDAVLLINDPGTPLLFQAPADYCLPDRYITVGEETELRISVDQRDDFRLMSLPYAVVARPEGPANGPCGLRIMDLCDIYTSWQAMTLAGLDWVDLLLGAASNNAPGDNPAALRTWGEVETEFANWAAVEDGGTRDWGELRDGL